MCVCVCECMCVYVPRSRAKLENVHFFFVMIVFLPFFARSCLTKALLNSPQIACIYSELYLPFFVFSLWLFFLDAFVLTFFRALSIFYFRKPVCFSPFLFSLLDNFAYACTSVMSACRLAGREYISMSEYRVCMIDLTN